MEVKYRMGEVASKKWSIFLTSIRDDFDVHPGTETTNLNTIIFK